MPRLENTDPLRLRSSRKAQEKEAERKRSYTRAAGLEWFFNNGKLTEAQYQAACCIRAMLTERHGSTGSVDYAKPRVDGSPPVRDWLLISSVDAERKLKQVFNVLGTDQALTVFRIAGFGETVQAVALEFEENPAKAATGKPSRSAREHVTRLFRDGLAHAAIVLGFGVEAPEGAAGRRRFAFRDFEGLTS